MAEIKPYVRFMDGYKDLEDGYTESPFGHYKNASDQTIESEYFMQWTFPQKLHRIALRTAVGFRLVYKQAEDVWNNHLGIKIEDDKEKAESVNLDLIPYLRGRRWFKEMEKLTAYQIEQGESILLLYFKDQGDIHEYAIGVSDNEEIIGVEAFNVIDYHIPKWDKKGEPAVYQIVVKTPDTYNSYLSVEVHPSRVMRLTGPNIEYRWQGYSDLAAVYDPINILTTILKATGEAAFRWSTGHPVIFTKDLFNETDLAKLRESIGDFTRKSWHMMPMEFVDRIDMMGQAGSMLNIKSLADIAIDNIVIGSGYPRPILLGEVAGVVSGSEVNERAYFALLDRRHTELSSFVIKYFERDINIRKLMKGVEHFTLEWGIREVLNRMDEAELRQKEISNALALMQICTFNECREVAGFSPLSDEEGGDIIMGQLPIMQLEAEIALAQIQGQQTGENTESTTAKQSLASTTKKSQTGKDLDKSGKGKLKDAFDEVLRKKSVNEFCREYHILPKTLRKMLDVLKVIEE